MRKESIYKLTRPDGTIFYIGKAKNPKTRLEQHKRRFGEDITIEVIDVVDVDIVSRVERFYIGYYLYKLKCPLVNKAKKDLASWNTLGDYRGINDVLDTIRVIEKQGKKRGVKPEQYMAGAATYIMFHERYLQMNDEIQRHVALMREIDPKYKFKLHVEY